MGWAGRRLEDFVEIDQNILLVSMLTDAVLHPKKMEGWSSG